MSKIIKRGLELLSVKSTGLNEDDLSLPPVYKSFISSFRVGREENVKSILYLHNRFKEKLTAARLVYLPDPGLITFGSFFSIEESKLIADHAFENENDFLEKYQLIGEDGTGHYFFMVGLQGEYSDQIFLESSDLSFRGGMRMTKIANDIFQFVNAFALIEIEDGLDSNISYDQLYRNWGEDFWRVREDE